MREARSSTHAKSGRTRSAGELRGSGPQDVARLLFADRLAHLVIDRRDDRRFAPAAREDTEFALALIRVVVHKGSVRRARRRCQIAAFMPVDLTGAGGG